MEPQTLKSEMSAHRERLAAFVATAVENKKAVISAGTFDGEVVANITLAIRHLEDAAMRFGKAIQAADGGKSPLGGPDTPKA